MGVIPWYLKPVVKRIAVTAERSEYPVLFRAGALEIRNDSRKYGGVYLNSGSKIEEPSALAKDGKLVRNMWKMSEALEVHIKA
jgi:hypothetical protein